MNKRFDDEFWKECKKVWKEKLLSLWLVMESWKKRKQYKNNSNKKLWETFRCICINCQNLISIGVASQELEGGWVSLNPAWVKVWVKNTLGGRGLIVSLIRSIKHTCQLYVVVFIQEQIFSLLKEKIFQICLKSASFKAEELINNS